MLTQNVFCAACSGLKVVLNTDENVGDLREHMHYIYSSIFVEYVTKNPLYELGKPFKCVCRNLSGFLLTSVALRLLLTSHYLNLPLGVLCTFCASCGALSGALDCVARPGRIMQSPAVHDGILRLTTAAAVSLMLTCGFLRLLSQLRVFHRRSEQVHTAGRALIGGWEMKGTGMLAADRDRVQHALQFC